ncbi:AAA family ATPase (plasmid) [Natrinema zhouii]|uniref:AAA family ATPase n=1 Tax=Natrinema zhouii TaxID=1710539 RepID=UPI001CFFDF7F|nr:AAA family ATPase [Natrinema zhouii]UHQ99213.1 AAA family ATPase [Natrinema zhouii]
MHLNELRIDDFGCFRNARLDNLDDSLVVIGGPQRAGKTTFMQALRQFRDGVSQSDGLPPATDEYRIDAEITHDGQQYRYVLSGHSSPSVSPISDGPEIDINDIFGPVTERQYKNLYTISLDELRRLPPGIDDSEDLARVLLGGAYGDIAEIPEIEESFNDQAHTIGLSKGNPNTKTSRLNDPYQTIREGIEARKEASQQVNEYRSVTEKLEDKRTEQAEIDEKIAHRQQTRDRLNVLKELFDPLQQLETLNARLEDVDLDAIDEFPTHLTDRLEHFEEEFETATADFAEARQEFDQEATIDTTDDYDDWLLEHETEIDAQTNDRKLLAKTAEELTKREEDLETKKQDIKRKISSLHSKWDGSFTHIDEIETSTVDTARVADLASTIGGLQSERSELKTSIESARTRKQEFESELEEMEEEHEETREITVPKRKPAIVAGIALAVGTGVGFVATPIAGGIVGLVVLAVGLYAIDSTVTVETTVDADPYREVKGQVTTLKGDIQADSERLAELDDELEDTQAEFTELVTELGLPESLPVSELPEFYEQIVELDDEIAAYREKRTEWEEDKEQFAADLEEVATLLEDMTDVSWATEEPLKDADKVLDTLETVATDLELARDVRRTERERTECLEDIDAVLTEWDEDRSVGLATDDEEILQHIQAFNDEAERINELEDTVEERDQVETQVITRLENESARDAFEPLREDDEPWIDVVRNAATKYADTDAIADEIREQNTQIKELKERRSELREACIELKQRQDDLASEDDLQEARAQIDGGRVEFERLGEAYAINRIAETMVRQLHERLMEDVVHSLVDDASTIFSEITQEYEGIELEGDVQNLEFRALRDEKPAHGIGELSRATAEQLFLAVRLARIRQTDVSLPVVLDDAATNFDPNHMSRVFDVVDELTATNQVFFLTCHPQCVRITASNDCAAQYWSLNSGQFTQRETADTLEQQLSAD